MLNLLLFTLTIIAIIIAVAMAIIIFILAIYTIYLLVKRRVMEDRNGNCKNKNR